MQFDKLFQVLERHDVKEIALQSDRLPCVLVNDQYAPLMKRNLSEEEVIAVLVAAGGRTEVMGLIEGQRQWDYQHPALGTVRVSAGYRGTNLEARLKRIGPSPSPAPAPAPAPALGAAAVS